jgi:hypothetical protein
MLLNPQDGSSPDISTAIKILEKYYKYIDAAQAINLLPSTTPVKDLERYMRSVLRLMTHKQRETRIMRNICKSESFNTQVNLVKERQRYTKIGHLTNCPVCGKRLGLRYLSFTTLTLKCICILSQWNSCTLCMCKRSSYLSCHKTEFSDQPYNYCTKKEKTLKRNSHPPQSMYFIMKP